MTEIEDLARKLELFAQERDWNQFHTPKNLAAALSVEASELLEEFLWLTDEQSASLPLEKRARVADEIGDVLNYLVRLSTKLGIDPISAAHQKLEKNALKYPIEKSKGNAKKYTEL